MEGGVASLTIAWSNDYFERGRVYDLASLRERMNANEESGEGLKPYSPRLAPFPAEGQGDRGDLYDGPALRFPPHPGTLTKEQLAQPEGFYRD